MKRRVYAAHADIQHLCLVRALKCNLQYFITVHKQKQIRLILLVNPPRHVSKPAETRHIKQCINHHCYFSSVTLKMGMPAQHASRQRLCSEMSSLLSRKQSIQLKCFCSLNYSVCNKNERSSDCLSQTAPKLKKNNKRK